MNNTPQIRTNGVSNVIPSLHHGSDDPASISQVLGVELEAFPFRRHFLVYGGRMNNLFLDDESF